LTPAFHLQVQPAAVPAGLRWHAAAGVQHLHEAQPGGAGHSAGADGGPQERRVHHLRARPQRARRLVRIRGVSLSDALCPLSACLCSYKMIQTFALAYTVDAAKHRLIVPHVQDCFAAVQVPFIAYSCHGTGRAFVAHLPKSHHICVSAMRAGAAGAGGGAWLLLQRAGRGKWQASASQMQSHMLIQPHCPAGAAGAGGGARLLLQGAGGDRLGGAIRGAGRAGGVEGDDAPHPGAVH